MKSITGAVFTSFVSLSLSSSALLAGLAAAGAGVAGLKADFGS